MSSANRPNGADHDVGAEQALLGALLIDRDAWKAISELIRECDFGRPDHRLIYAAMVELAATGVPADVITVAKLLDRSGKLTDAGGMAYLGTLAKESVGAVNITSYADIVLEDSRIRALKAIAVEAARAGSNGASSAEILTELQSSLRLFQKRSASSGERATGRPKRMAWSDLKGEPPPRLWWWQDWLSPDPLLLAGAGGIGKSRFIQTLGTAFATGSQYLGPAATGLRVFIWSCEERVDDIWRLQHAINQQLNIGMEDLEDKLHIESRVGCDNTLIDFLDFNRPALTPAFELLREQVRDLDIDMLVLDNVAQVFGCNENDKHHVTMFVNAVAGMVRDRPFCPVFLHHVARTAGSEFSGSAAWENAVRMRWYLGATLPGTQPEEDDVVDPAVVYLAKRKANYAAKDWRRLRFHNGVLVPDEAEQLLHYNQGARDGLADTIVMEAILKLQKMGVHPTDGRTSPDYLPTQILNKRLAQGHSRKDLVSAMNRLMAAGRLKRGKVETYGNRTPRMGLVIV